MRILHNIQISKESDNRTEWLKGEEVRGEVDMSRRQDANSSIRSDPMEAAVDTCVVPESDIQGRIVKLCGVPVMLDSELAAIYGYATKDFNRQVKNNIEKFDDDFMFELIRDEWEDLRCKNSTSSWGGAIYHPLIAKLLFCPQLILR